MTQLIRYSIIIPVYNRPDELDELLESITKQTYRDYEVIVVEDGSTVSSEHIVSKYNDRLTVYYYQKPNSGPGLSRNYGAERSKGEYFIILDSDCILPSGYLDAIEQEINAKPADAFGGPDRAHQSFTDLQKAINYSMTSFLTTGGIRGGKKKLDKFYPRSFNMGIRASVYKELGGFADMRFGEDVDFSIRIYRAGYSCRLFPGAWVYHKRRTDLKKFFKQVHNSGIARINLYKKYPDSLKLVHILPALFTIGFVLLIIVGILCWWFFIPVLFYVAAIFFDATLKTANIKIGLYSVAAAFTQLTGYGSGFLWAWWRRCVLKKDEFSAFNGNFYK